ncbi:hypothetical protein Stsp01_04420 [Streptomyces sp. NBRC 13847]|nr:hypothetical protein Stsp01_04420 [Streptomyces sp. NBRC 13847]
MTVMVSRAGAGPGPPRGLSSKSLRAVPPPRPPAPPHAFTLPSVRPVRQYRWSTVISTISGTTDNSAPPTVYW